MHTLTILFRYFPYWALALVFVFWELGLYFRRRGNKLQWSVWGGAGLFIILTLLWFFFRGDKHSDEWVRTLVG